MSTAAQTIEPAAPRSRSVPRAINWSWLVLGLLLLAGAVLLMYETHGESFRDDEWKWIFDRRGGSLSTYLQPYNQHLELVPIAIYKVLFATAGLRSYVPYRAVGVAADLTCAAMICLYLRPRVGVSFATLTAALILLFGPGWEALLWPINMSFVISITAGIAALPMLDRDDRFGNVGASLLLVLSLASDDVGVAVAAGLIIDVLQRRRWRNIPIVAVPAALYIAWWLNYQQNVPSSPARTVVRFVFEMGAGVSSSLVGLSQSDAVSTAGSPLTWGRPLVIIAALALVGWLWHQRRVPARVVSLLVMLFVFWISVGIGRASLHFGSITVTWFQPRYLFIGAVIAVLLIAEVLRGVRAPRWLAVLIGAVMIAAMVSNFASLRDGAQYERDDAAATRATLGAVQITRSTVAPNFTPAGFVFSIVSARQYLAAVAALGGTAADSPTQIAAASEPVRTLVDSQLIQIEHVGLTRVARPYRTCTTALAPQVTLTVPAGGLEIRSGAVAIRVSVRRFGSSFIPLGSVPAHTSRVVRIAADRAPQRWRLQLATPGAIAVCTSPERE